MRLTQFFKLNLVDKIKISIYNILKSLFDY